jgi:hypothetical protein
MLAKYILAGLAVVFVVGAALRGAGHAGWSHPQAKAWLLLGVLFGAVSAWLFFRQ